MLLCQGEISAGVSWRFVFLGGVSGNIEALQDGISSSIISMQGKTADFPLTVCQPNRRRYLQIECTPYKQTVGRREQPLYLPRTTFSGCRLDRLLKNLMRTAKQPLAVFTSNRLHFAVQWKHNPIMKTAGTFSADCFRFGNHSKPSN
jgi:hypothetical protein